METGGRSFTGVRSAMGAAAGLELFGSGISKQSDVRVRLALDGTDQGANAPRVPGSSARCASEAPIAKGAPTPWSNATRRMIARTDRPSRLAGTMAEARTDGGTARLT